jgi:hypothetical protein
VWKKPPSGGLPGGCAPAGDVKGVPTFDVGANAGVAGPRPVIAGLLCVRAGRVDNGVVGALPPLFNNVFTAAPVDGAGGGNGDAVINGRTPALALWSVGKKSCASSSSHEWRGLSSANCSDVSDARSDDGRRWEERRNEDDDGESNEVGAGGFDGDDGDEKPANEEASPPPSGVGIAETLKLRDRVRGTPLAPVPASDDTEKCR